MSKDYKDRVTPRGKKTGIYSGLLWFLSGTALGGLLIGAGVMWLKLGPPSLEEVPILPKTETPQPKPNAVSVAPTTPPETTPPAAAAAPTPPKLEFEYDKILRDAQVTLPDPNQDAQIKITQPPPPKEPSPVATTVPFIPDTQPQPTVITTTLPVATDTEPLVVTKVATKRSATSKKTKTSSTSTSKSTSKKLADKSSTKAAKITKTAKATKTAKITKKTTQKRAISDENFHVAEEKSKPRSESKLKSKSKTQIVDDKKSKSKSTKQISNTQVAKNTTKSSTEKTITSKTTNATKKKSGVVQLGAFQNEEDVKKLRARMALMGVETTVEKVTTKNNKTVQRLRTIPYKDKHELNEAKKLFTKHNIKTYVVQ